MSKKVILHISLCALLIYCLLCGCSAAKKSKDPTRKKISGNSNYFITHPKDDLTTYYYYNVTEQHAKEDFIVIVKPLSKTSDPDIYISNELDKPGPSEDKSKMVVCSSYGYDICFFPKQNITNEDSITIGVYCKVQCSYKLEVHYSSEYKLQLNSDTIIFFSDDDTKVVSVSIPNDKSINHINIEAHPLNSFLLTEGFHMKVQKQQKDDNSNNTSEIFTRDGWSSGKIASIEQDDEEFCINCKYRVILQAQNNTLIKIKAWQRKDIMDISLDQRVFESLIGNQEIIYVLNLTKVRNAYPLDKLQNSTINIEVVPYTGTVDLHVNPEVRPGAVSHYRWNAVDTVKSVLVLTPEERQKAGSSDSIYYIAIKPYYSATFSLYVYLNSKDHTILNFGVPEIGSVLNQEIVNYKLLLWTNDQQNLTVSLASYSGNADLYIKKCQKLNIDECKITIEEIHGLIFGNYTIDNNLYYFSNGTEKTLFIRFLHNPQQQDKTQELQYLTKTVYVIAVFGNSTSSQESEYQISVQAPKIHYKLREGTTEKWYLGKGEEANYVLTLSQDQSIDQVTIHFTTVSGQCDIYVSRESEYPDLEQNEQLSFSSDDSFIFTQNDTFTKNNKEYNLYGPYYISVQSFISSCQFLIAPTLVRKYNNDTNNTTQVPIKNITQIQLIEGVSFKYSLAGLNDSAHFRFKLKLNQEFVGGLNFNFIPHVGQFIVFISNTGQVPDESNYIWSFRSPRSYLYINTEDPNFKRDGTYLITVKPLNESLLNSTIGQVLKFEFSYYTQDVLPHLLIGIPNSGWVNASSTKFYKLYVNNEIKKLRITKITTSDEVDIYISLNPDNHYPNNINYNVSSLNSVTGIITLTLEQIQSACPSFKNSKTEYYEGCYIYLGVHNKFQHNIEFTITVRKKDTVLHLYDGISIEVEYPSKNEQIHFLHSLWSQTQSPSILVTSHSGRINIYARLVNKTNEKIHQIQYPNSTYFQISSSDTLFASVQNVIIPQEFVYNCTSECALAITVTQGENYFGLTDSEDQVEQSQKGTSNKKKKEQKKKNQIYNSLSEEPKGTFVIEVVGHVQKLREGQPTRGYINKNGIRYYSFEVNRDSCNILISLAPLGDGDPDLFVDMGSEKRPTAYEYRWASVSRLGEELQIAPEEFNNQSMAGTYIIAVTGNEATSYILTIVYEEKRIIQIYPGFPFDISLNTWDYIFFDYNHYYQDSFTLNLQREAGDALIGINVYNKSQDYISQLPTAQNSLWKITNGKIRGDVISISSIDNKFCYDCQYLIGVNSTFQPLKALLLIKVAEQPIYISPGRNFEEVLEKDTYAHYIYEVSQPTNIEITIQVLHGQPEFYVNSIYAFDIKQLNKGQYVINSDSNYHNKHSNIWKLEIPVDKVKEDLFCRGEQCTLGNNKSVGFKYTNYHIVCYSQQQNTSYIIMVKNGNSSTVLHDGAIHIDVIDPAETQTFVFLSHHHIEKGQRMTLTFSEINRTSVDQPLPSLNIKFEPKQIFKNSDKRIHKNENVLKDPFIIKELVDVHGGKIHLQFEGERGRYIVNITNNQTNKIYYSIVINSHEITRIPFNVQHYSFIHEQVSQQYEMVAPTKGELIVKFTQCFGSLNIGGSKIYEHLANSGTQEYDDVQIQSFDGQAEGELTFDVDSGQSVYIIAKMLQGFTLHEKFSTNVGREAYYKIESIIVPFNDERAKRRSFYPGNSGMIGWLRLKGNTFKFQFYGVVEAGDNPLQNTDIKYILYIGKDPLYLEILSRCGNIQSNLSKNFAGDFDNMNNYAQIIEYKPNQHEDILTIEATVIPSEQDSRISNYYAVVIAKVQDSHTGEVHIVNYDEIQFSTAFISQNLYRYMVGAVILLIGLLIVVALLYRKYIVVKQRLVYEMQDIRNVARVNRDDRQRTHIPIFSTDSKDKFRELP